MAKIKRVTKGYAHVAAPVESPPVDGRFLPISGGGTISSYTCGNFGLS
jgi:hypothetical protein